MQIQMNSKQKLKSRLIYSFYIHFKNFWIKTKNPFIEYKPKIKIDDYYKTKKNKLR